MASASIQHPDLLNARQVAERLNIKRSTLYVYLSRGILPAPIRPLGRTSHPRWLPSDVDQVVQKLAAHRTREEFEDGSAEGEGRPRAVPR